MTNLVRLCELAVQCGLGCVTNFKVESVALIVPNGLS